MHLENRVNFHFMPTLRISEIVLMNLLTLKMLGYPRMNNSSFFFFFLH